MEKEFVPYDRALRLKKLGFDEPCFAFHKDFISKWILMMPTQLTQHEQNNLMSYIEDGLLIDAPTFSQAFRWFREKYGLLHELISCVENSWLITIVDLNSKSVNGVYMKRIDLDDIDENVPNTYEEAELACLDKLIEYCQKLK